MREEEVLKAAFTTSCRLCQLSVRCAAMGLVLIRPQTQFLALLPKGMRVT